MIACWIGAGGNLGHVGETIESARRQLQSTPGISAVQSSRHFRSAPMGAQAGAAYTNAVLGCLTDLAPLALLDVLQQIEAAHGRTREIHWGPRTLDLDLLYYGDQQWTHPRLTLPHPGRIYRRFVLDPLCELVPDWRDPVFPVTVRQLGQRLAACPRQLIVSDVCAAAVFSALAAGLEQTFDDVVCLRQSQADVSTGLLVGTLPVESGWPCVPYPEALSEREQVDWLLAVATAAFTIPSPVESPGVRE